MAVRGARFIRIEGARQNNLKGVTVRVPVGAVTAVTGVAGAGKSSLAFDVLYAEGYRRYVETFSPYARQFLERLDRPRADRIEGVLPAIAIDRTAPVRTSRSTVGTMSSIADYLRALYARASTLHCRGCGAPVERDSPSTVFDAISREAAGRAVLLCFAVRVGRVRPAALRDAIGQAGFRRVLEDGRAVALEAARLEPRGGAVRVVVDRVEPDRSPRARLVDSIETALRAGKGRMEAHVDGRSEPLLFSEALHCPRCDVAYADPTPAIFSFNNPVGACETCKGFGRTMDIDPDLVVPDPRRSIAEGCIRPFQGDFYSECQRDLLRFLRRRGLSPPTCPGRSCPRRCAGSSGKGSPAGARVGRPAGMGSRASSSGSSRAPTGCTCACSSRATGATCPAPTAAAPGSSPARTCSGSATGPSPRSRRCPSRRRSASSARGRRPAATSPRGCSSARCARASRSCATSGSATSRSRASRGRSPAARRSA